MPGFGATLLSGSPRLFWTIAPFAAGGAAVLSLPPHEDAFALASLVVADVAALLLVLGLWPYRRIRGARRALMGWVAAACTTYVLTAWFPGMLPSKGEPANPWLALAGFLVVGLPSWKYALLGRFALLPGPIALPPDDTLLQEARARARAELQHLAAGWPSLPPGLVVQFAFVTDGDVTEHLWGEAVELREGDLVVEVLTEPETHGGPLDRCAVPLQAVEDFLFDDGAGRFYGDHTTEAFRVHAERESLPVLRRVPWRRARAA